MAGEGAYVSTREAAQLLSISLRTAQLWVEQGVLLAWKTSGGHRRILLDSVEKILTARKELVVSQTETSTAKLKIALVEDDIDLLKLLEVTISEYKEAIEIQTATDGFRGLVMIGEFKPDVLIADLNMPHMDGFRMLKAIQGSEFSPKVIIVTTALSKEEITLRGGLPLDVFILEKPFLLNDIEKILNQALTH